MKRIFSFMFIATVFLMTSCSSIEKELPLFDDSLVRSDLLYSLSTLNDSLIQTKDKTRVGLNPAQYRRACIIAADIGGAVSTGKAGFWAGGFLGAQGAGVGAVIGALCGGASGSYVAYVSSQCTRSTSFDMDIQQIINKTIMAYTNIKEEGIGVSNYSPSTISVIYPETANVDMVNMGTFHNAVLDKLLNQDFKEDSCWKEKLTLAECSLLNSEEFNTNINGILEKIAFALEQDQYYISESNELDEKVMNLFFSLITSYPDNLDDIEFIINKYIEIVKNNNELSDDQKQLIYAGLSVAASSSEFWNDKIN